MNPMETTAKIVTDGALGGAMLSAPLWIPQLHSVNELLATVAALGGLVVLGMRIYLSRMEIQQRKAELAGRVFVAERKDEDDDEIAA